MNTIEVAAAIIRRGDKIFATQRGYGEWKDYWEYPGGKLEEGETPEQALVREIREELDTEIRIEKFLCTIEWDYPRFHLTMHCYICSLLNGALHLNEHEAARWLGAEDLDGVSWLPADYQLIPRIKDELKTDETVIAIIGAGAAGCFCAARLRELAPQLHVAVYEAGPKPLAKVAITGGGRCNLTNTFAGIRSLTEAYPRGERLMKRLLKGFSQEDAMAWFEAAGVPLVTQDDHCVFPRSQDAMDVVRALRRKMGDIPVRTGKKLISLTPGWTLRFEDGTAVQADAVIVTTGGAPKGIPFLEGLDIEQIPPVPSLFTFTIGDPKLRALMGLVIPAAVGLPGTAFRAEGPLLITDWGLSGPAALKLSSYAARFLAEHGYRAPLAVNWPAAPENAVRDRLLALAREHPQRQLSSTPLTPLPGRLWTFLLGRAGLREDLRWAELGSKGLNRLTAVLTADSYVIEGKSRFRDEFVTCGGVALSNVDPNTLECKSHPGLYFAGEVLDIDAITGGFNLQAAWTTGHAVAQALLRAAAL